MTVPLDAVTVIHNAFRKDMAAIDNAAYVAAKGDGDLSAVVDRLKLFSYVLEVHADGEEEFVFTAVDKIAPQVAAAYEIDHREFDTMTEGLAKIEGASNALDAARETMALMTHLRIHLHKEDTHLYPILREALSPAEQGPLVGAMAAKIPAERYPDLIPWMMAMTGDDDRETITRVWMGGMPEPVFAGVKGLIQKSLGNDWAEMTRRIPELV